LSHRRMVGGTRRAHGFVGHCRPHGAADRTEVAPDGPRSVPGAEKGEILAAPPASASSTALPVEGDRFGTRVSGAREYDQTRVTGADLKLE